MKGTVESYVRDESGTLVDRQRHDVDDVDAAIVHVRAIAPDPQDPPAPATPSEPAK